MPETNQIKPETVDLVVQRATDNMNRVAEHGKDVYAIRCEFLYKLAVLNGGTLALTLSAATAFHTRGELRPLANVSMLLHAYEFLIGSIILSLIATWIFIEGSTNARALVVSGTSMLNQFWLDNRESMMSKTDFSEAPQTDELDRLYNRSRILDHWGIGLSISAQIGTILAFIFLFLFVRANLATL
jgi:hypothetical protein